MKTVPTWLLGISCGLCLLAALAAGRQPAPRATKPQDAVEAHAIVERGVAAGQELVHAIVVALRF